MLHLLPEEMAHLCPVRAYAAWISVTSIQDGYVFRKLASGDRPLINNEPMVYVFLNSNNNLLLSPS
jgi:hypothetical protein